MINDQQRELMKQLPDTAHGRALKDYLDGKLKEILDVSTCNSWEETLGRKYAAQLIKDLFYMMEKRETVKKSKNTYE